MNYQKHYDLLIERAKLRQLDCYKEKHRIKPGCMGGTYDIGNVVYLTPEEHYVAHQLLVKIYNYPGLIQAARMMCVSSAYTKRNNKIYGWLKRRYYLICKERIGAKNTQFETVWIYNLNLHKNKKIKNTDQVPDGWLLGRQINKAICKTCKQNFFKNGSRNKVYCSNQCKKKRIIKGFVKGSHHSFKTKHQMSIDRKGKGSGKKNSQFGTIWITNGSKVKKIKQTDNMPKGYYRSRKTMPL